MKPGKQYMNKMRSSTKRQNFIKKRTEHILELKNTATELEISIKNFNIRLNQAEERISKHKDMAFKIIQLEEQKNKNEKK